MISSVRGLVLAVTGQTAVIEVGGVGLSIQVTPRHAAALTVGTEARVRTALIVREDDLSLFGFAGPEELAVFDFLRGVTGVGPKSALGVLGALDPVEVARAVDAEDDAAFRRVSGIGPKTAKLIVLSLAGKLSGVGLSSPARTAATGPATPGGSRAAVLDALIQLGWAERTAAAALDDIMADRDDAPAVPELLRAALAHLGPQPAGSAR